MKKRTFAVFCAFLIMCVNHTTVAQDPHSEAVNELSGEMLNCAGFYAILAQCFGDDASIKKGAVETSHPEDVDISIHTGSVIVPRGL